MRAREAEGGREGRRLGLAGDDPREARLEQASAW